LIRTDQDHVTITERRQINRRTRSRSHGRGASRPVEPMKGAHTEVITMDTYKVDATAVADAIVARLMAGKALK
jgi:hypothetical protein